MVKVLPLNDPLPKVLEPYAKHLLKSVKLKNSYGETSPLYSFFFGYCTLDLQLAEPGSWNIVVKSRSSKKAKEVLKDYPNGVVLIQKNTPDGIRTYRHGANDEYIAEMLSRLTANLK